MTHVYDASGKPIATDVVTPTPGHAPITQLYSPPNPDRLTADDVQRMITSNIEHTLYHRDALNAQRALDNKKKATIAAASMVAGGVVAGVAATLLVQRFRRGQQGRDGGGGNNR